MDTHILLTILLPPIAGLLGFILKYALEKRTAKRLKINKHSLERIEMKLKVFYQPILTNLIREHTIYTNLIKLNSDETIPNQMMIDLDNEILKIHLETQKLIQDHIVDVNPNDKIFQELSYYDQHVLIFELLRKYKEGLAFPKNYGVPYPKRLREVINGEIERLKKKQKTLLGDWKAYKSSIGSTEPVY